MAAQDCLDEIERAAGRKFSDDELIQLYKELGRRERQRKLLGGLESDDEAVRKAAQEYAQEMAKASLIERRNAAINLQARIKMLEFVRSEFPNDPAKGLQALLVGTNRLGKGALSSAAAYKAAKVNQYLGGFLMDLEKQGMTRNFTDGHLDKDIARALFALNRKEALDVRAIPQEAIDVAKVIMHWQDVVRADANRAGAFVGKLEGYMVRQSHDDFRMRGAGYEAWRDNILPKLDRARTFGDEDPEKFLKEVYRGLASGVHLRLGEDQGKLTGFKGTSNIAKKASQERVLHFQDADAWYAYNEAFGLGSIREAVLKAMEINGQNTGVMQRLGTNPEDNIAKVVEFLKSNKSMDIDKLRKLDQYTKQGGEMDRLMATLLGRTNSPINDVVAQWGASARVIQNMAKLGGSLLAQFGDLAARASEVKYQGRGFLTGLAEGIQALGQGRRMNERAELYGMLGVYFDNVKGQIATKFTMADDGVPGLLSRMQQLYFKLNGMTWWADVQRSSSIMMFSHQLALRRGEGWDALSPELRRVLRQYSIEADEWNVIRSSDTHMTEGKAFLTPEGVNNLPDNVFAGLLQQRGKGATPRNIAVLKEEISQNFRTYLSDRGSYSSIVADEHTRATLLRGSKPGTLEGEALRFIAQFKSFPVAFMQRTLAREAYGYGENAMRSSLTGFVQVIAATTAFGYLSDAAKDLTRGRNPKDPLNPKTWVRAMVQGGGLGIYGDYLLGEAGKAKYGGNVVSSFAGPMAGSIANWADVIERVFSNIPGGDEKDIGAAALRSVMTDMPFANLFYTRLALDYAVLWRLQESLNPGSIKRMEKRVEDETGQTFWLKPSSAIK